MRKIFIFFTLMSLSLSLVAMESKKKAERTANLDGLTDLGITITPAITDASLAQHIKKTLGSACSEGRLVKKIAQLKLINSDKHQSLLAHLESSQALTRGKPAGDSSGLTKEILQEMYNLVVSTTEEESEDHKNRAIRNKKRGVLAALVCTMAGVMSTFFARTC